MTQLSYNDLASFAIGDPNAPNPYSGVVVDAAGDVFGTTYAGGSGSHGSIYELANGSSVITTLASFNLSNGAYPVGNLILDQGGNLYGTTSSGGGAGTASGTVFELAKGSTSITTLVSFPTLDPINGTDPNNLILDAAGNLFGATQSGGAGGDGTLFELANGTSSVTTLVSFDGTNGGSPQSGLIMDAAGDIFGITPNGAGGETLFELAKGAASVTTLASFLSSAGTVSALVGDAAGDIFGATSGDGAYTYATLFELAKGSSSITTLATVRGILAANALLLDGNGALFGSSASGDGGALFEAVNGSVTDVAYFTPSSAVIDGAVVDPGLTVDAAGDLFVTTSGATTTNNGSDIIFELKNGGFVPAPAITRSTLTHTTFEAPVGPFTGVTITDNNAGATETLNITVSGAGGKLAGTGLVGGTGNVYTLTGTASAITTKLDALVFTASAGTPGSNRTTNFTLSDQSSVATVPVTANFSVVDTDATAPSVQLAASPSADNAQVATLGTVTAAHAGDNLSVSLITDADFFSGNVYSSSSSTLALNNGTLLYTPGVVTPGLVGTDQLTYVVTDTTTGATTSETQTVTLGSGPGPLLSLASTPVASNESQASLGTASGAYVNDTLLVTLTSDAVFASGSSLRLYVSGPGLPGDLIYTPGLVTSGLVGTDQLTYTVTDTVTGAISSETQTVTLDNGPVPSVSFGGNPIAANFHSAVLGTAAAWNGSDTLSVKLTSDADFAAGSTLVLNNGSLIYTPGLITAANAGSDTLAYTVTDTISGAITSEIQTVTLSDAPTPKLTVLASFNGTNGAHPFDGLLQDAAGDLFGTTSTSTGSFNYNGTYYSSGAGMVFEVAHGTSSITTLANFTARNSAPYGILPTAGLVADAAGDLFGVTQQGGSANAGTLFEVAKGSSSITLLASFAANYGANPQAGLIADAAGDLFGTTSFGTNIAGGGTVFELAKGTSSVTILASFYVVGPASTLVSDAAGNLFGATQAGGASGDGTVFELPKGSSLVTILASFTGSNDASPLGALVLDAAGNIFGTTSSGGSAKDGTVFELAKGHSVITTLATFTGSNGAGPEGGLIVDAIGDLFGTTSSGGSANDGSVFELAKGSSVITTLVSFKGSNGSTVVGGLTANAAGDLFGTAEAGGAAGDGTVFEVTNSGFVPPPTITGGSATQTTRSEAPTAIFMGVTVTDNNSGATDTLTITIGGAGGTLTGTGLVGGTGGVYTLTGTANAITTELDALLFTATAIKPDTSNTTSFAFSDQSTVATAPVAATGYSVVDTDPISQPDFFSANGVSDVLWQSSEGTVAIWDLNGSTMTGAGVVADPGAFWHVVGSGDFNGTGTSDVLLQGNDGSVAVWMMNGGTITEGAVVQNFGTTWHVEGTGNFSGAGPQSILLQSDAGTISEWTMNGATLTGGAIIADPGAFWHVVGTGDFNATGTTDILMQGADGSVAIWDMNGSTIASSAIIAQPGLDWQVVGVGDFNNDGASDIVLQSQEGSVAVWEMNAGTIATAALVADPGSAWHVVGTGNYAGPGDAGILLQDNFGDAAIWQMTGTTLASSTLIGCASVNWQTIGQGTANFINGNASAGTLAATPLNDEFIFTSTGAGAHAIAGFDPFNDMIQLSAAQFGSYAGVQADTSNVGGSAVINLGGGATLTLQGVLASELSARNFLLG